MRLIDEEELYNNDGGSWYYHPKSGEVVHED